MLRLGLTDNAKSIFLESRSKKIRLEIRKLKFEGDIQKLVLCVIPYIIFLELAVKYCLI